MRPSASDEPTAPEASVEALPSPTAPAPLPRYDLGPVLGRGGMGEVRLARDTRVDREVAVKLMHRGQRDEASVARFLREAYVQGALEHPAVVPVHDLGRDPDGNPYFVMKRLAGTTLATVLGEPARQRWPRRQLLTRFVDVCLAVELAHTRGIVHRDIKPANIMLGDFGEAYLLDWGLARIVGDDAGASGSRTAPAWADGGHTLDGAVLGTPGYMAPEQAMGEPVGPAADVFSLGCVLFEIVAGVPALPRGADALAATIDAIHHRPTERAPDAGIPPELDDLCVRATALDPQARPSARELAERVQAYLDGDLDLARRRALAEGHAARARAALATPATPATPADEARASAMREAGRALAIDPSNELAQQILGHLLLVAPEHPPAAASAAADAERARTRQHVMRSASRSYFLLLLQATILLAFPLHHRWPTAILVVLALASWLTIRHMARRLLPMQTPWYLALLWLTSAMIFMTGVVFGPLLIMPIVLTGSLAGFLSQPTALPAWVGITAHAVPFVAVHALEGLGLIPPTFWVADGTVVLAPWTLDLTPSIVITLISVSMLAQFLNTAFIALAGRRAQIAAQDRVHAQAWHLEQLLPHSAASHARTIGSAPAIEHRTSASRRGSSI